MRLTTIVVSAFLFFLSFNVAAQDGQALFKQNCSACHLATDKTLIGPGLQGVVDRVPSEEWILKWVKDPDGMIASGDAYANKIKDFSPASMTPFGYLEDAQILAIIEFLKNPPAPEVPAEAAAPTAVSQTEPQPSDRTLIYVLAGVAVLLIVLVILLRTVQRSMVELASEKSGVPAPEQRGPLATVSNWIYWHRGWSAFFALVLLLAFLRWGFGELLKIGVYQEYQPKQPIAFSHQIHAGQNGINCLYCHTSAEKGKTAGIPSLNVCMNCHTYISKGPSGTAEIAKIYAALDYDPETKTYGDNPKPIQWVRVHNLTDLSYFNHSQHVVVGKIQCQQCHGQIQDMPVVKQFAPLTMGWCINCHRQTSVQVADNGYYEDMKERTPAWHDGNPITVDRIGGLECSKCHY